VSRAKTGVRSADSLVNPSVSGFTESEAADRISIAESRRLNEMGDKSSKCWIERDWVPGEVELHFSAESIDDGSAGTSDVDNMELP